MKAHAFRAELRAFAARQLKGWGASMSTDELSKAMSKLSSAIERLAQAVEHAGEHGGEQANEQPMNTALNTQSEQEKETPSIKPVATRVTGNSSLKQKRTGDFESRFWSHYPRKVSKKRAMNIWQTLDEHAVEQVENDLVNKGRAQKDERWREQQFIPHPDKYLRGALWEDEWDRKLPLSAAEQTVADYYAKEAADGR